MNSFLKIQRNDFEEISNVSNLTIAQSRKLVSSPDRCQELNPGETVQYAKSKQNLTIELQNGTKRGDSWDYGYLWLILAYRIEMQIPKTLSAFKEETIEYSYFGDFYVKSQFIRNYIFHTFASSCIACLKCTAAALHKNLLTLGFT